MKLWPLSQPQKFPSQTWPSQMYVRLFGIRVLDNIRSDRVAATALNVLAIAVSQTVVGEVEITVAARPRRLNLATGCDLLVKSVVAIKLGVYSGRAVSLILVGDVYVLSAMLFWQSTRDDLLYGPPQVWQRFASLITMHPLLTCYSHISKFL